MAPMEQMDGPLVPIAMKSVVAMAIGTIISMADHIAIGANCTSIGLDPLAPIAPFTKLYNPLTENLKFYFVTRLVKERWLKRLRRIHTTWTLRESRWQLYPSALSGLQAFRSGC